MWKIIIVFILFSIIAKFPVLAFHCYLDTTGSPPPKEGEPLLLDNFKAFDCNLMKSKDAKVRFFQMYLTFSDIDILLQPCMMKTDAKSGLITRNCSPELQKPEGCEIDVHGNTFCYCYADYCNDARFVSPTFSAGFVVTVLLYYLI